MQRQPQRCRGQVGVLQQTPLVKASMLCLNGHVHHRRVGHGNSDKDKDLKHQLKYPRVTSII